MDASTCAVSSVLSDFSFAFRKKKNSLFFSTTSQEWSSRVASAAGPRPTAHWHLPGACILKINFLSDSHFFIFFFCFVLIQQQQQPAQDNRLRQNDVYEEHVAGPKSNDSGIALDQRASGLTELSAESLASAAAEREKIKEAERMKMVQQQQQQQQKRPEPFAQKKPSQLSAQQIASQVQKANEEEEQAEENDKFDERIPLPFPKSNEPKIAHPAHKVEI